MLVVAVVSMGHFHWHVRRFVLFGHLGVPVVVLGGWVLVSDLGTCGWLDLGPVTDPGGACKRLLGDIP